LIDLHTHTTASDGRCAPAELVERAAAAGVKVLAVTDHDTVAACQSVGAACATSGIEFVPGIEVTAVRDGVDVHTLGYFFDVASPSLSRFLAEERGQRMERVRQIVSRLETLGMPLDADTILQPARDDPARSAGRPWVARALVAAGYVATTGDAFRRFLGRGMPAFVARLGAPPAQVITRIHEAGGIASLAHPGLLGRDEWLPDLVESGLDAIEAYHTDHDHQTTERYLEFAERYGVGVSGGSDYHGDPFHGGRTIGAVSLPAEQFERLKERATRST